MLVSYYCYDTNRVFIVTVENEDRLRKTLKESGYDLEKDFDIDRRPGWAIIVDSTPGITTLE